MKRITAWNAAALFFLAVIALLIASPHAFPTDGDCNPGGGEKAAEGEGPRKEAGGNPPDRSGDYHLYGTVGKLVRFTDTIRNKAEIPARNLKVYILIPQESPRQKILSFSIRPAPDRVITDRWGQKIAVYRRSGLGPGKRFEVNWLAHVKLSGIQYHLSPEKAGTLADCPDDVKRLYLCDGPKYKLESETIRRAARAAVGDEKNPYWIAKRIHDYIIQHLAYKRDRRWDDAATVVERGSGSCSEYTFLTIALARAVGLPARYVGGTACRAKKREPRHVDRVFHRWAEVYIPPYGWVPMDSTRDDSIRRRRGRDKHFGGALPGLLTLARGDGGKASRLRWDYRSYHRWKGPKKGGVKASRRAYWVDPPAEGNLDDLQKAFEALITTTDMDREALRRLLSLSPRSITALREMAAFYQTGTAESGVQNIRLLLARLGDADALYNLLLGYFEGNAPVKAAILERLKDGVDKRGFTILNRDLKAGKAAFVKSWPERKNRLAYDEKQKRFSYGGKEGEGRKYF
jgi:hypothetical protein